MTLYSADVNFKIFDGQFYQVDADDEADAEFQILDLAKEDFPEGTEFCVNNIQKVHKD